MSAPLPGYFQKLAHLLNEHSGLLLAEEKSYLAETRLKPVAQKWGYSGIEALVRALGQDGEAALFDEVIDAMTTNESYFFRDAAPFRGFREQVVPTLLERRAGTKRLHIWSAACSSGQEPYSLAMLLAEMGERLKGWSVRILATDISQEMLDRARRGVFTQFEARRGVPQAMLRKYFEQSGDHWRVVDEIRRMVEFRHFNLLRHPSPLGRFDVVFCRNVLIYFDRPKRTAALEGIADVLAPDGYLALGGAETVLGLSDRFRVTPNLPGYYRPAPQDGASPAGSLTRSATQLNLAAGGRF